jgi:flavin-dependent dehydrogenase
MHSERGWWLAVTRTGAHVVVIGTGVAGSTAALVAAQGDQDVVLIDRPGSRRAEHGETLPPEAKQILLELGIWEAFERLRFRPCWANRSVWGSDRLHTWDQLYHPYGSGWHVERHRLERMLRDAAIEAGARLVTGPAVGVHRDGRAIRVVLDGGAVIEAGFVVDGTGRSAMAGRQLGAERVQYDHLIGLVRHYDVPAEPSTLVEAVPDGWWYSAPTATGLIVIMFGDADLIDWRRDPAKRLAAAPNTMARIAATDPLGEPALLAASTSMLHPLHANDWVAVGDAAATYDPLGSYGLLHGLVTGWEAIAGANGAPAVSTYAAQERARFDDHLRDRRDHFHVERRWQWAPFWRRRAEVATPGRRTEAATSRGSG